MLIKRTFNHLFINNFALKILAMIFMTLDHVGLFLCSFSPVSDFSNAMYLTGYIFRIIGRIAFPLFVFMLVEGIRKSKNIPMYLLRIGILTSIVIVATIIIDNTFYSLSSISATETPLSDLFLCALTLYLLNRKDKYSILSALPIGFILLSFGVSLYESNTSNIVTWLPNYIRPDYTIIGLVLSLAFYYSYDIAKKLVKNNPMFNGLDFEVIKKTPYYQGLYNILCASMLFILAVLIYVLGLINIDGSFVFSIFNSSMQTWCLLAILFIVFYNGKRGYNAKWFQYSCYFYFPVHIVIISVIFYVLFML